MFVFYINYAVQLRFAQSNDGYICKKKHSFIHYFIFAIYNIKEKKK